MSIAVTLPEGLTVSQGHSAMLPLPLPSLRHCQPWLTPRAVRYSRVQGSRTLDLSRVVDTPRSRRRRVCTVSWYWLLSLELARRSRIADRRPQHYLGQR
jgi:hypothetical protein